MATKWFPEKLSPCIGCSWQAKLLETPADDIQSMTGNSVKSYHFPHSYNDWIPWQCNRWIFAQIEGVTALQKIAHGYIQREAVVQQWEMTLLKIWLCITRFLSPFSVAGILFYLENIYGNFIARPSSSEPILFTYLLTKCLCHPFHWYGNSAYI